MTELIRLLDDGGLCLGLLDPVSNIILNILALLPYDAAAAASPPAAKRSRGRSYRSLVNFVVGYFGCLTEEQAARYLYWARADLPLAVMLVQHDLYEHDAQHQPQGLDPDSARTQAAFKWAAQEAGHPAPDTLVQLMAIRLYPDAFALLKKQFAEVSLSSENVRAIHRLLHRPYDAQMTPCGTTTSTNVSADGSTITTTTVRRAAHRITSLRQHIDHTDMAAKLSSCLTQGYAQKHTLKTPCSRDACDYLQSLEMHLHGMLHHFYITALTLLPTPSGSLMRSFLMAGHCYGSMDLVSNIIVNSIWYDRHGCPLPESERTKIEQYIDILDPLSLFCVEMHSLKGLTELAALADPQLSVATCALENLCSAKCDIATMLQSSTERFEKNPFHEASMAAGHPLPLQLGELQQQLLLMPVERNKLLSLMTEAQTGGTVLPIDDVASILDMVLNRSSAPAPALVQAPELCVKALSVVSSNRSYYEKRRRWFRSKLERILKEYATLHFWEPKYTLDYICGVEESGEAPPKFHTCYHVNFMATCELRPQKTLFFAEFWLTDDDPMPSFCCTLPYPYAGRCYYGVRTARKIVYPDRAEYIGKDITDDGTGSVGGMLQMDHVYFSSEGDVELAKNLNILPSSESRYDSDSEYED
ncbi:hypothetical protein ACQ4PT_071852 [Festuca glaucescens]